LKKPVVGKKNQHQNQCFREGPLPQWTGNSTTGRGQFFSRVSQRGMLFYKSCMSIVDPRLSKCKPSCKISVCDAISSEHRSCSTFFRRETSCAN